MFTRKNGYEDDFGFVLSDMILNDAELVTFIVDKLMLSKVIPLRGERPDSYNYVMGRDGGLADLQFRVGSEDVDGTDKDWLFYLKITNLEVVSIKQSDLIRLDNSPDTQTRINLTTFVEDSYAAYLVVEGGA